MQDNKDRNGRIRRAIQVTVIAVMILISAVACVYVMRLYDRSNMESFEELVSSFGPLSVAVMLLIQIAQVVFAIIPGEPVELIMGALYGTFWGCVLCIVGICIGTLLIFLLVKKLGRSFDEKVVDSEKFKTLKFLNDPAKRDSLTFLLMFIPGTPKDLLTYASPFAGIPLGRFVVIAAVARIPSVITSTYVGASFISGNYIESILIYAAVGAVSLAGILIYNGIVSSKNKDKTKEN